MRAKRILAFTFILLMLLASKFFPDFLLISLIADPYLPLGSLIGWLALISLAVLPWLTSDEVRTGGTLYFLVLKYVSLLALGLAVAWPFVGRLIAGNWHFSFGPSESFTGSVEAGYVFWRFTGLVVLLPLVVFILILGQYLIKKL